jgi:omega-hydroxy-beta-dihydromenaquinone-9 sulfotransferase
MALDHVIFPSFGKMKVRNPVLITGVPRSATTYLYKLLAGDRDNFTCFKLWELLFAPSIIQKHILSLIIKVDRWIGRPLYRTSHLFDRIFLARIARLHEISLSNPEEDEILLIHAFASVYLSYFFPDVLALEPHHFFDEDLSNTKRNEIMHYYKKCIQRHVYFYDRDEKKHFLSKNPSFISKTTSLAKTFENARLIYMLRSPLKTIPSTISLNKNIYSIFSGRLDSNPLSAKTKETIIRWYKMADRSMLTHWQHRSKTIPFRKVTSDPATILSDIYTFLKLTPGTSIHQLIEVERKSSLKRMTTHDYQSVEGEDIIKRKLDFIFDGPFRDDI